MTAPLKWTESTYESLETVLRAKSGLIFTPLRRAAVEVAANRVMARIAVNDPAQLVRLLEQGGAVFDDLMAEVTIGETYFFREAAHFTLLRRTIVPHFAAHPSKGRHLRAWSAGCSTGEEAYSIALALREEKVASTIVGTDVSRARLGAARRGMYRRWSFRGVPQHTIDRYFARDGEDFTLSGEIRRDVEFRYLNLASDCYPSMGTGVWGMDVIFCRNVLIYFDHDTIARVAKALLASLASDGWLLPGATDPPLQEFVRCEVVQTEAGLVYRPFHGAKARASLAPQPALPPIEPRQSPTPPLSVFTDAFVPAEPTAAPAVTTSGIAPAFVGTQNAADPESADEAYAARDYPTVVALISSAAADGSATAAESVHYIRALANLGRLDEAGRACAAALDLFRDNAELHYLHAVLIAQSGQFAESARAAKRAIYLDRTMIVAYLALGSALASNDDAAGARRAFASSERLLAALPSDAPVPCSDGEPAGRLLEMTRVQAKLVKQEDVA